MSNPTTPFSWQMPTNTDLVTDLPADFEVFGQAVATSMADLLGGTTGQVLSKTTNADMDFTWVSANPGDITGVTAGTGISGGGTSGTVTVTNSMATAIDAKGDLIVGTGADAFSRLAVGTNNYVLTADSVEATGMKWAATVSGTTFVGCSVSNVTNSTVSATNNTVTTIPFDTEAYDTDGFHSTVTNTSRMTIPAGKAGKYICTAKFRWDTNTTGTRFITYVINGTDTNYNNLQPFAASPYSTHTAVFSLAVGDYIECAAYQDSGGTRTVNLNQQQSLFTISYLGA